MFIHVFLPKVEWTVERRNKTITIAKKIKNPIYDMVSELECEMEYDWEQKFVRRFALYPNFIVYDFEAALEKAK